MERITALMPRARQEEIVVEELPDETLVYDLKRHKAHCLNPTSALVWQHCDGRTTVAEVAALLESRLKIPADEAVVWMALDRLGRTHLLRKQVTLPAERARYSRREVLRTLRRVAGISLLLPAVESIVAPRAAAQASCITDAQCELESPTGNSCSNTPICGTSTQCCKKHQSHCDRGLC